MTHYKKVFKGLDDRSKFQVWLMYKVLMKEYWPEYPFMRIFKGALLKIYLRDKAIKALKKMNEC